MSLFKNPHYNALFYTVFFITLYETNTLELILRADQVISPRFFYLFLLPTTVVTCAYLGPWLQKRSEQEKSQKPSILRILKGTLIALGLVALFIGLLVWFN